jgi:L-ribulose-5-phosphate 4-epimerase
VREGVIKYNLDYKQGPPLPDDQLADLIGWHKHLYNRELIGQSNSRYEGYAYGNISKRLSPDNIPTNEFIISGSQTGGHSLTSCNDYSLVTDFDISQNRVTATGPILPSSESLTHAAVYLANSNIRYVFHVHSPDIWKHATELHIPVTPEHIEYGTPELAEAVISLISEQSDINTGVFSMGGHVDGIVSYGETADEAGNLMLSLLDRATLL